MEDELTHIDKSGKPKMVDISEKKVTERYAKARASVILGQDIMSQLEQKNFSTSKGSIIQTAIIAATMAAKRTSELIPFCHLLSLDKCNLTIEKYNDETLEIICEVKATSKTGVEMEALTGASVAALTVYDMTKALSKSIEITGVQLLEKRGGKSDYVK